MQRWEAQGQDLPAQLSQILGAPVSPNTLAKNLNNFFTSINRKMSETAADINAASQALGLETSGEAREAAHVRIQSEHQQALRGMPFNIFPLNMLPGVRAMRQAIDERAKTAELAADVVEQNRQRATELFLAQARGQTAASAFARGNHPLASRLAAIDVQFGFAGGKFLGLDPKDKDYAEKTAAMADLRNETIMTARADVGNQLFRQRAGMEASANALRAQLAPDPVRAQIFEALGQYRMQIAGVHDTAILRQAGINFGLTVRQIRQQRANQEQIIDVGQAGENAQLDALLRRDPHGAEVAAIVAQRRAQEAQLRQQGLNKQADKALELGRKQLDLERQDYLEGFRAAEVGQDFIYSLTSMNRRGPNPAQVLKEIEDAKAGLGKGVAPPAPAPAGDDLPGLLKDIKATIADFAAKVAAAITN
jgi:hypothetical protein